MIMDSYIVGIDGGGTKTTAKVVFCSGRPPVSVAGGPLNINGTGRKQVAENIRTLLGEIETRAGPFENCSGICIGAAGFSNPVAGPFLKECTEQGTKCKNIKVTSDSYIALCGALKSTTGAILIAGTGSICHGVNEKGDLWRTGGAGHLIDDEGGGYAIGRDILSAIVRDMDGRGPKTVLTQMLKKQKGIHCLADIIAFTYDKGTDKSVIASLSPLLADACSEGDQAAKRIAEKAVQELFQMAATVVDKLGLAEQKVAFGGSILLKERFISLPLTSRIQACYPDLSVIAFGGDAADGAVYLAERAELKGLPVIY